eukprot:gene1215-34750_t
MLLLTSLLLSTLVAPSHLPLSNCCVVSSAVADPLSQPLGRAGSIACPPASTQEGSTPPLNSKHQSLHQQRPPRLVLFLPGTRLQPQNYTLVALEAAKTGSYVLSLNWVNWGCRPINSGVPTCMENLTVTSAACTVACYRGPLFGEFQPFGPATNPLNLTVHDSIIYRVWHALHYLNATNTQPNVDWGQFIATPLPKLNDVTTASTKIPTAAAALFRPWIAWSSVAVVGHSQGSMLHPAPWVSAPGKTPGWKLFMFGDLHGRVCPLWSPAMDVLGIGGPQVLLNTSAPFAPQLHEAQQMFCVADDYCNGKPVRTASGTAFNVSDHSAVAMDCCTPLAAGSPTCFPNSQWLQMLGFPVNESCVSEKAEANVAALEWTCGVIASAVSILQSIILMPSQSRAAAPQRLRVVAAHLSARTVASGDAGKLVVLITGVTSGLGRALCEEFAARNHIIVGYGRREDRLAELRATMPSNCLFSAVDTTHASEVATWAYHVHRKYPKIDLLINNAGKNVRAKVPWQLSPADFDSVIDVNVKSVQNVVRAFVPRMVAAKSGVIVNFSSGLGHSTNPMLGAYTASKFAVEALTKSIAQALPEGMAAVPLAPGVVQTEMNRNKAATPIEVWVKEAAPFILELSAKDNGKSLIIPQFYSEEYQKTWILPAGLGISKAVVFPQSKIK